jgi:hypothetical protein
MLAAFQNLSSALQESQGGLDSYVGSLQSASQAVDEAAAAQEKYISILKGAGTSSDSAAASAEQLTGALSGVGDSINQSVGGLTQYNTVIGEVGSAQTEAASTSADFGHAIQENVLALGVAASGILGIIESITRLERAQLLAQKASLAYQQALATEASATLKLQTTIDKYGATSAQAAIASQKLAVAHEKTGLAAERADLLQQQLNERQAAFAIEIIPHVIEITSGLIQTMLSLRTAMQGVTTANLLAASSFRILLASTGIGALIAVGTFFLGEWMSQADEAKMKNEALSASFEEFSKQTGTSVDTLGSDFTDAGSLVGEAATTMEGAISALAQNMPADLAKMVADSAEFKATFLKNITITPEDVTKATAAVKVAPGVTLPKETEAERQKRLGTGVGESQFGPSKLTTPLPSLQEITGLPSVEKLPPVALESRFSPEQVKQIEAYRASLVQAGTDLKSFDQIMAETGVAVRTFTTQYSTLMTNSFGLTRPLTTQATADIAEMIAKITQASRTLATDPRQGFVIDAEIKKLQAYIQTYNQFGTTAEKVDEVRQKIADNEKALSQALGESVQATQQAAAAGEIYFETQVKLGDITAMRMDLLAQQGDAEQAAIADLTAFANAHKIAIPIWAQSAQAIDEWIQVVLGVGPAAQKASQEFIDSFFKMTDSLGKAADDGKQFWKDMKDSMLPKDFKREVKEKLDIREDVKQFLDQFAIDAQLAQMLGASNAQIGKFRDEAIDTIDDLQKRGNQSIDLFLQPLEDMLKDPNLKGEALVEKALAWVKDPQTQAAAKALNIDLSALQKTLETLNGTAAESAKITGPLDNIISPAAPGQKKGFGTEGSTGFVDLGTAPEDKSEEVQKAIDLMDIYNTKATTLEAMTIPAPVKDGAFDSTIQGVLTQLQTVSGGGGGGGAAGGGGGGGATLTSRFSPSGGPKTGGGGGGGGALTPIVIPPPDVSAFQAAADQITGIMAGLDVVFLSTGAAAQIAAGAVLEAFATLEKETNGFANFMIEAVGAILIAFAQLGEAATISNDAIVGVYGILDKSTKAFSKAMTKDLGPIVDLYASLGEAALISGAIIVETYALLEKATKAWQKPMNKELGPVVDLFASLGEAALMSGLAIITMQEEIEKTTKAWLKPMTKNMAPVIALFDDLTAAAAFAQATIDILASDAPKAMASAQKALSKTASQIVSTFNSIGSAAAAATSQVNALASAINSLKDKTVTVTYKQSGKPGQYGLHEVTDSPSVYIAGEAWQPEEVIVRPLFSRGYEQAEKERKAREDERRKYSGIASMMQRMNQMMQGRQDRIVFGPGGRPVEGGVDTLGKIKQLVVDLKSDVIVDRREIMQIVRKYLYEIED